jgi:hypothetical protein
MKGKRMNPTPYTNNFMEVVPLYTKNTALDLGHRKYHFSEVFFGRSVRFWKRWEEWMQERFSKQETWAITNPDELKEVPWPVKFSCEQYAVEVEPAISTWGLSLLIERLDKEPVTDADLTAIATFFVPSGVVVKRANPDKAPSRLVESLPPHRAWLVALHRR